MKKLFFGLVMAMAASLAHGSFLYWQIDSSTGLTDGDFRGNTISGYRIIAISGGDTYSTTPGYDYSSSALTISYPNDEGTGWSTATTVGAYVAEGGNAYANLEGVEGAGYSYYIEVMGYDTTYGESPVVIAVSSQLRYSDASGHLVDSLSSLASVTAWTGTAYSAPEPTSGLLLLVGASLLALKRRKV